jgi:hypothetical protein
MRFEPLEVIENPFYFGIGGIGDFLLLMATCYDEIMESQVKTDIVFVCNNVNVIRRVACEFPSVCKFWFYPNSAFPKTPEMWASIRNHRLCRGTGVTPKNFDYVADWIECGKTNVFDYYGVTRNPRWASAIETDDSILCIQPRGGADDKSKRKEIPISDLEAMIDANAFHREIVLIGSLADKTELSGMDTSFVPENCWAIPFNDAFKAILSCDEFISCDTWGKTLAGLAGKPVHIYPNQYPADIETIFNHPVDPSDYVFLKDWGFTYADGRDF